MRRSILLAVLIALVSEFSSCASPTSPPEPFRSVATIRGPRSLMVGQSATFVGYLNFTSPDPLDFVWTIGDSTFRIHSDASITRLFRFGGIYPIRLQVTPRNSSFALCEASDSVVVKRFESGITPEKLLGNLNSQYTFVLSHAPFPAAYSVRWTFLHRGESLVTTVDTLRYRFALPTFDTLIAACYDTAGSLLSYTTSTVSVGQFGLTIAVDSPLLLNLPATFRAKHKHTAGHSYRYIWSLDGVQGDPVATDSVTFKFTKSGVHEVGVRAVDGATGAALAWADTSVTVRAATLSLLMGTAISGRRTTARLQHPDFRGPVTVHWIWGDGSETTGPADSTYHSYRTSGQYTLKAELLVGASLVKSITRDIEVLPSASIPDLATLHTFTHASLWLDADVQHLGNPWPGYPPMAWSGMVMSWTDSSFSCIDGDSRYSADTSWVDSVNYVINRSSSIGWSNRVSATIDVSSMTCSKYAGAYSYRDVETHRNAGYSSDSQGQSSSSLSGTHLVLVHATPDTLVFVAIGYDAEASVTQFGGSSEYRGGSYYAGGFGAINWDAPGHIPKVQLTLSK